jgi:transporter family protein
VTWYILALVSAFLLSLARVIEKKVLEREHALEFSASSGIFRVIVLILMIPLLGLAIPELKVLGLAYLVSLIACAAFLYRSKATRHMPISEVDPLFNVSPLLLVLLSYFFLGERISSVNGIGIFLMVAGVYILELDDMHHPLHPLRKFFRSRAIHHIGFAVVAMSFGAMLDKFILTNYLSATQYLFWVFMFISINFVVLDLYRFGWKDVKQALNTMPVWTALATCLHLMNIVVYYTVAALPNTLISLIIPLRRTSTLFSTIIGGSLFKETRLKQKLVATAVIIAGAYFVIL